VLLVDSISIVAVFLWKNFHETLRQATQGQLDPAPLAEFWGCSVDDWMKTSNFGCLNTWKWLRINYQA